MCVPLQDSAIWTPLLMRSVTYSEGSYFVLILSKFMYNVSLRRESRKANQIPIFDLPTISPLIYSFLRDSAFYFFLCVVGIISTLRFPDGS